MTVEASEGATLLLGERSVLELIATGAPLAVVLNALCRVIDEQSGLISCVYLLDREGRQLRFEAGPQLPGAWRRLTASYAAVRNNGACGTAVCLRHSIVVENIASSPMFRDDWRAAAAATGLASVWSTPFLSKDGRVLGTFAVFDRTIGRPTSDRLRLVERATRMASIIVEWHEAEAGLRESERRFSTVFYASPASMAITRFSDRQFISVDGRHSHAVVSAPSAVP